MEWDPRRASRQLCYRSTRRYVVVRLVPKADTGKDKRLGHSGIQSLRLARRVIGESSCAFSLFLRILEDGVVCRYTTKQKRTPQIHSTRTQATIQSQDTRIRKTE